MQEVSAAVRFSAAFQEVQAPVTQIMKALQAQDSPGVRRCAVVCACALAPCLPRHQVGLGNSLECLYNFLNCLSFRVLAGPECS